jgi:hypothetical protein
MDCSYYEDWFQEGEEEKLGVLFMYWWFLWKERNRRIFDQESRSSLQTARLIIDDVQLIWRAFLPDAV